MISKISKVSFKSIPLYDVKIKKRDEKGSFRDVDATFSLLNPKDREDIKAMHKIGRSWWRTKYAKMIIRHFNIKLLRQFSTFYALELKGDEPLDKRIISLCEVSNSPLTYPGCYIDLIQTSPEISKKKIPKYKGTGEVTLYGVIREAYKNNIKSVELTSSDKACDFYKHAGFKPIDNLNGYALSDWEYREYISRVENKYGF